MRPEIPSLGGKNGRGSGISLLIPSWEDGRINIFHLRGVKWKWEKDHFLLKAHSMKIIA